MRPSPIPASPSWPSDFSPWSASLPSASISTSCGNGSKPANRSTLGERVAIQAIPNRRSPTFARYQCKSGWLLWEPLLPVPPQLEPRGPQDAGLFLLLLASSLQPRLEAYLSGEAGVKG